VDRLVWSMAVDTPDTAPDTAASPGDHASCGDCAPCDDVYQHRYIHTIVTYTYPDSHDVSKMQCVCVRACACVCLLECVHVRVRVWIDGQAYIHAHTHRRARTHTSIIQYSCHVATQLQECARRRGIATSRPRSFDGFRQ
jgi:hypothetical protein